MQAFFGIIWSWLVRLVAGWLPFSGSKLGKIIWVIGIVIACFAGYKFVQKVFGPTGNTQQKAETIVNHYYQPKVTFGCASTKAFISQQKKKEESKGENQNGSN